MSYLRGKMSLVALLQWIPLLLIFGLSDAIDANISLWYFDEDNNIETYPGDEVSFFAFGDGTPMPTFTWFGADGKEISNLQKNFTIRNDQGTRSLRIHDTSKQHEGIYTLQANNSAGVKRLNFNLTVISNLDVLLTSTRNQICFTNYKNEEFQCTANSEPKPKNITWAFRKWVYNDLMYSYYLEDEFERKDAEITSESRTIIFSAITMNMTELGRLFCTACNEIECKSKQLDIYITDGAPDKSFGVIRPKEDITVGDNVTLICAAVKSATDTVTWFNDQKQSMVYSERIHLTWKDTRFTRRVEMFIENVTRSDEKKYYCSILYTLHGLNEFDFVDDFNLKVNDPEMISFIKENMHNTEVSLSVEEAQNPIHLWCYVKGMPKPKITWYKNGVLLEKSEMFSLVDGDQKLTIRSIMKSVLEDNSVNYSCRAENRLEAVQKFRRFTVKGRSTSQKFNFSFGDLEACTNGIIEDYLTKKDYEAVQTVLLRDLKKIQELLKPKRGTREDEVEEKNILPESLLKTAQVIE